MSVIEMSLDPSTGMITPKSILIVRCGQGYAALPDLPVIQQIQVSDRGDRVDQPRQPWEGSNRRHELPP